MKIFCFIFCSILFTQTFIAQEDSYHTWIKTYLESEYSVTGGEWVLTNQEITTNNLAQYTNIQHTSEDWSSEEPFTKKVTFTNASQRTNSWDAAIRYPTQIDITEGDALLLVIWVKANSAQFGNGMLSHIFEKTTDPYTKSLSTSHLPSDDWQMWMLPFESEETYSAGTARYQINMGVMAQSIEIGGLALINYGANYSVEQLPETDFQKYYDGQEPDASWRAEAQARIEQYRMENLTVNVVDANDNPLEGATVDVQMKKHKFGFGTAISVSKLIGTGTDSDIYREKLQDLTGDGRSFNVVVIENALKWPTWESSWPTDKQGTADAITTLRSWGLKVRGHNLVWPGWSYLPDDIEANSNNPDYITQRIQEHIADVAGYPGIKGELFEWDVINEAAHNTNLADVYGTEDIYKDWFDWAEAADPNAKLFLNEYSIINSIGMDFSSQEKYHEQIENLLNAGAKLGGIGIQGHFNFPLTSPERIYQILEDFAQHNLDIEITEYDAADIDGDIAANYIRDLLTIIFSHPKVTHFLMWGFWDGAHYHSDAPIFNKDWTLKPSGEMFIDLVFNKWWTNASLTTGSEGNASVAGYLGDYEISVDYEGHSKNISLSLDKGNGNVEVKLEDVITGTGNIKAGPAEFRLHQNYPNPFNPFTNIIIEIPEKSTVELCVYDLLGNQIDEITNGEFQPGIHSFKWDGSSFASGIYFLKMNAQSISGDKSYISGKKIILMK